MPNLSSKGHRSRQRSTIFKVATLTQSWTHKHIALIAASFAVLISTLVFTGSIQTTHGAKTTAPNVCHDIVGTGPAYPPGNSGQIDFAYPPTRFADQACVQDAKVSSVNQLRGWAWNTNLGWVSTYCSGGASGENLGTSCGTQSYSSSINPTTGEMEGHWWGDGIGWIVLNCKDLASGCTAANGNFRVVAETTGANKGKIIDGQGFAWSDNVGWIDLADVVVPWAAKKDLVKVPQLGENPKDPLPPTGWTYSGATTVPNVSSFPLYNRVYAYITPDPAKLTAKNLDPQSNLPLVTANGTDAYTVNLHMVDINGQPLGNNVTVEATLTGKESTVKTDQINNKGDDAVTWTNFTETSSGLYQAKVTSIAPTSNFNGMDTTGNGKFDCYFAAQKSQDPALNPKVCLTTNVHRYRAAIDGTNNTTDTGLKVKVTDRSTNPATIYNLNVPIYGNRELKFAPPVDVQFFSTSKTEYKPLTNAQRQQVIPIHYKMVKHGSPTNVKVDFNVSSDDDGVDLLPLQSDNITAAKAEAPTPTKAKQIKTRSITPGAANSPQFNDNKLNEFFIVPLLRQAVGSGGTQTATDIVQNPSVKSTISYQLGGKTVQYFGVGTPPNKRQLVNPVASIQGPVNIQGAVKVSNDTDVRSANDISTDKVRAAILQNVQKFLAGIKKPTAVNNFQIANKFTGDLYKGLVLNQGNVVYFKGNLTINCSDGKAINTKASNYSTIRKQPNPWFDKDQTIIVEGNLIINCNITPINSVFSKPGVNQLGVIVLEDRKSRSYPSRGGNVYIHPDVTDLINVNLYADGLVTRYDPSVDSDPLSAVSPNTGEPQRNQDCADLLPNQFYWLGSISGRLTIGGSEKDPVVFGGGRRGVNNPATILEREQAQLYDINFLSCFQYEVPGTKGPNGWPLPSGENSFFIQGVFSSPTIIKFNPASSKLPGFSTATESTVSISN